MPVPKRKRSRARRDSRHAHKFIKVSQLATCVSCSAVIRPHQVCNECGHYKGSKVLTSKADRHKKRLSTQASREAAKSNKRAPSAGQNAE